MFQKGLGLRGTTLYKQAARNPFLHGTMAGKARTIAICTINSDRAAEKQSAAGVLSRVPFAYLKADFSPQLLHLGKLTTWVAAYLGLMKKWTPGASDC